MKKVLAVVIAFVMVAVLATGCAQSNKNAPGGTPAGGKKIGLALSTLNNPFFVTLRQGAETRAKALNAQLIVYDAQDDSAKQSSQIDDLIQKKVDLIIINPTDSDAAKPAVQRAQKAGIPVISVDRGVNGVAVTSHIASDNVAGGKMAGDEMVRIVGTGAKIVELQGIPGASAAIDRGKGFDGAAAGRLNIVSKQPADFNRDKGFTVMQNILQRNKDIKGVFAQNDEMALGAVKALQAANIKDVAVIGFDATSDALAAIKQGTMRATIAQKPDLIGSTAVDTAMKFLGGQKVDKFIPVPLELINK